MSLSIIDAKARVERMDHAQRHLLRKEKAPALPAELRTALLAVQKRVLPKSAAGKAANYTLSLWSKLILFLEYPELELSNNLAENSMRPVAIGRKNWIHLGSREAGPKVAAIFSVVESCRRLGLPIREYLAAALPGLANRSIQSLHQITQRPTHEIKHNSLSATGPPRKPCTWSYEYPETAAGAAICCWAASMHLRHVHLGTVFPGGISPILRKATRIASADVRSALVQSTFDSAFISLGTAPFARGPRLPRAPATHKRTESSWESRSDAIWSKEMSSTR